MGWTMDGCVDNSYKWRMVRCNHGVGGWRMGGEVIEKSIETKSSAQGREGGDGEAGVPWR